MLDSQQKGALPLLSRNYETSGWFSLVGVSAFEFFSVLWYCWWGDGKGILCQLPLEFLFWNRWGRESLGQLANQVKWKWPLKRKCRWWYNGMVCVCDKAVVHRCQNKRLSHRERRWCTQKLHSWQKTTRISLAEVATISQKLSKENTLMMTSRVTEKPLVFLCWWSIFSYCILSVTGRVLPKWCMHFSGRKLLHH